MSVLLLVLGIAIVVFGAFVLIRFADRPGASVKWLGMEISSKGAGVPLIGLGLACAVFAVQVGSGNAESKTPEENGTASISRVPDRSPASSGVSLSSGCLARVAESVPEGRVFQIESEMRDLTLIDVSQPQQEPFVVLLSDGGDAVGALRIRQFQSGVSVLFKLESVVDSECREIEELSNISRGGNPRALMNWDTVRMRFGDRQYDMRIGGEGDIGVNFLRRVL